MTVWIVRILPAQVLAVIAVITRPVVPISFISVSSLIITLMVPAHVQDRAADLRRIRPRGGFRIEQQSGELEVRHVRAIPTCGAGNQSGGCQVRFHEHIALKHDLRLVAARQCAVRGCIRKRRAARERQGRTKVRAIRVDHLNGKVGGIKHQSQVVQIRDPVLDCAIVNQVYAPDNFLHQSVGVGGRANRIERHWQEICLRATLLCESQQGQRQ